MGDAALAAQEDRGAPTAHAWHRELSSAYDDTRSGSAPVIDSIEVGHTRLGGHQEGDAPPVELGEAVSEELKVGAI